MLVSIVVSKVTGFYNPNSRARNETSKHLMYVLPRMSCEIYLDLTSTKREQTEQQ